METTTLKINLTLLITGGTGTFSDKFIPHLAATRVVMKQITCLTIHHGSNPI